MFHLLSISFHFILFVPFSSLHLFFVSFLKISTSVPLKTVAVIISATILKEVTFATVGKASDCLMMDTDVKVGFDFSFQ